MQATLYDNHGRPLNYLRIAVTDRCNLRCFYCMPEEGIAYLPKKELLTYEEMVRLIRIMAALGITKVRITGGEPFVRNDLMSFLHRIVDIPGINDVHLTTNGVLTAPYIKELGEMGIASVNLSLDTLDPERFKLITRRNTFTQVMKTLDALLAFPIPTKVNAVVMDGKNIADIIPLTELTRSHPVEVRFIEEMPFNGEGSHYPTLLWTYKRIASYLKHHYPELRSIPTPVNSTSELFSIPGYKGTVGIIAAFSRTFCGTCNRIRVTAQGDLKTCLYDNGVLNLKALLRSTSDDSPIVAALLKAFRSRPANGHEAEEGRTNHLPVKESMSTIGG